MDTCESCKYWKPIVKFEEYLESDFCGFCLKEQETTVTLEYELCDFYTSKIKKNAA